MRFRFVGAESTISNIRLNEFGQALDLSPEIAHEAVLGRIPLVTEEAWAAIPFTEDELSRFSQFIAQKDATESFNAKKILSHRASVAMREQYELDAAAGNTFMKRAATPAPQTAFDFRKNSSAGVPAGVPAVVPVPVPAAD